jgi:hypothetical protein
LAKAQKQKTIYLSGKGKWFHKLFNFDEFRGNRFWAFDLYPDPASLETFKKLGVLNKLKENDEGKYVTLRRNVLKKWKLKPDENPEFEPPEVTNADGEEWGEDMGIIGNGSAVTAKLEHFETANGPAIRLNAVRIDDLVEYIRPDAVVEEEAPPFVPDPPVKGKRKAAIPF